jgi:hypothetical protein
MTEPLYENKDSLVLREENTNNPNKKRLVLRDMKTGRIVKSTKRGAEISAQNMMRAVAERIMTPDADGNCEFNEIITSMVDLAKTGRDKEANAAVKAAQFIRESAFGMAAKSDLDRQAESQPIKVVVVGIPEAMMNKTITEEKPKPALKPSFIDAEIVTNEPQTALVKAEPKPVQHTKKFSIEKANVGWLMQHVVNDQKIQVLTTDKSMSAVQALAEKEPPVCINRQGVILQGWLRVASAFIGNPTAVISVEVCDVS